MRMHYTEEEANAILRRAIERQPMKDEMTREQMESIAKELGIAPEELQQAETEWQAEQEEQAYRQEYVEEQRRGFRGHLTSYVGVMTFLTLIYVFAGHGGYFWVIWPMLGWGLGLFFHFAGVYLRTEQCEEEYRKWLAGKVARQVLSGRRPSELSAFTSRDSVRDEIRASRRNRIS